MIGPGDYNRRSKLPETWRPIFPIYYSSPRDWRILDTEREIARVKEIARQHPDLPSVQASVRSLEKRLRQLEEEEKP